MTLYHWRTDAASGTVEAESAEHALELLIEQGEWSEDAVEDGGWIAIGTDPAPGNADLVRGVLP